MKTILTALILASTLTAPALHAGSCPPPKPAVCKPAYAYTKIVGSRKECRWYTDKCGKRVSYEVTYLTYTDYYTDGSTRTYTKEVRA